MNNSNKNYCYNCFEIAKPTSNKVKNIPQTGHFTINMYMHVRTFAKSQSLV